MKKVIIIIIGVLILLYGAALAIPFDPEERRPGTRLSGELASPQETDWSFLDGRAKIWVETNTWYGIPHSVTTTSWVDKGVFYVPCGNCDSKRWPRNVERDPEVRLKVGDEIYLRNAVRIAEEAELRRVLGVPAGEPLKGTAVFRMEPR